MKCFRCQTATSKILKIKLLIKEYCIPICSICNELDDPLDNIGYVDIPSAYAHMMRLGVKYGVDCTYKSKLTVVKK